VIFEVGKGNDNVSLITCLGWLYTAAFASFSARIGFSNILSILSSFWANPELSMGQSKAMITNGFFIGVSNFNTL
jgi:hypothetical protein